jgi:LPXTG-motif cell wall-anchored protein
MGKGCTGQELSLVSYTAPSDTFSRETASQQRIFQAKTGTFGDATGTHTYVLSVNVPSCFFQIDFVTGKPIAQFGPAASNNFYSDQGRLLAGFNGGMTSCNTTNGSGAHETPQSVTPNSALVGSPTDTSLSGLQAPGATSTPNGTIVAGSQTAPGGVGSVTPIVEIPGVSDQQAPSIAPSNLRANLQANLQANAQNGAVAGIQSLPSTSTGTPTLPLAAIGLAILALGGALLRRRDTRL